MNFWKRGEPAVWASGASLAAIILIALILIFVVVVNGLGVFWPHTLTTLKLKDGTAFIGEFKDRELIPDQENKFRVQFKIGNRDLYGLDFRWFPEEDLEITEIDEKAIAFERMEYGNFYGFIQSVNLPVETPLSPEDGWKHFKSARKAIVPIQKQIKGINKKIDKLNDATDEAHFKKLKLEHEKVPESDQRYARLDQRMAELKADFDTLLEEQSKLHAELHDYSVTLVDAGGKTKTVAVSEIVRAYRPNAMGVGAKLGHYGAKIGELLFDEPREANTEGGLFPAIFGTIMLVFVMSIFSFPLGVIAGIYLREYAKEGWLLRGVRIAVNNLAGVPSIVYGVFGLGFFVYGIGSGMDALFFPERLPEPTFGTGGLLWASLTLGLLTLPVVIVSTEEAFGAIPRGVREASLALGATKYQTLMKVLLPMASPGIMTGFILAMARAAGEVAPLMITGVVKLAPSLPVDGQAPFLHLNRKFMHLGFHIYDIGFQSPNVEAAKPMVFVTTLLLVLIVLVMTSTAIVLRNRMKKRFTLGAF